MDTDEDYDERKSDRHLALLYSLYTVYTIVVDSTASFCKGRYWDGFGTFAQNKNLGRPKNETENNDCHKGKKPKLN